MDLVIIVALMSGFIHVFQEPRSRSNVIIGHQTSTCTLHIASLVDSALQLIAINILTIKQLYNYRPCSGYSFLQKMTLKLFEGVFVSMMENNKLISYILRLTLMGPRDFCESVE